MIIAISNKTPGKNVEYIVINKNKINGQIIGIGAVAGMRTTFAPAIISHYLSKQPNNGLKVSKLNFINSPIASLITKLLALSETVGDKLPSTPNRTDFPQILGRVASGALAGAILCKANNQHILKGILLGGSTALAATYGAFYARKYADSIPGVKDIFAGATEDILALGIGVAVMK